MFNNVSLSKEQTSLMRKEDDQETLEFGEKTVSMVKKMKLYFDDLECHDDHVIIVCGNTGSGKSTLINYFSDRTLVVKKSPFFSTAYLLECDNAIASISHKAVSETTYPGRYECGDSIYWDCPGFEETRGISREIANAYGIKRIKEKADKFSVLGVVEESAFFAQRGGSFRRFISKLSTVFSGIDTESLSNATTLCVNKVDDISDFLRFINQIAREKNDLTQREREIINKIADKGRLVEFPVPTDNQKQYPSDYKDHAIQLIQCGISLKKPDIEIAISHEALECIDKLGKYVVSEMRSKLSDVLILIGEEVLFDEYLKDIFSKYQNDEFEKDSTMLDALQSSLSDEVSGRKAEKIIKHFEYMKFLSLEIMENIISSSGKYGAQFTGKMSKDIFSDFFDKLVSPELRESQHLSHKKSRTQRAGLGSQLLSSTTSTQSKVQQTLASKRKKAIKKSQKNFFQHKKKAATYPGTKIFCDKHTQAKPRIEIRENLEKMQLTI